MGIRPRIGSLLSSNNNTEYIERLTKLEQLYDSYLSLRFETNNRYRRNPRSLAKLNLSQQIITETLEELKQNQCLEAPILISKFNDVNRNRRHFPYNALFLQKKIQNILYFEHAKKLTFLIASYNKSQSPEDKQKIDNYVSALEDKQLFAILNTVIDRFKENPTDRRLENTNTLLGYFHKQIVKETYSSSINSHMIRENATFEFNSRKIARADFNGGFYTLSRKDLSNRNPFSKAYQEFTQKAHKPVTSRDDYNLEQCPAWQACQQSKNFKFLEMHFKNSLVHLRVDPSILKDLNVVDILDIMTPDKFSDRMNSHFISFKSLCPLCAEGERQKLLNTLDTQKLDQALTSVSIGRGKVKTKEVHHNSPINIYGVGSNNESFTIIPIYLSKEEKNKHKHNLTYDDMHDFMHRADLVLRKATKRDINKEYIPVDLDERHNGDIMFHMIDTREEECRQNGKIMIISGLRENNFATVDLPKEQYTLNNNQNSGAEL